MTSAPYQSRLNGVGFVFLSTGWGGGVSLFCDWSLFFLLYYCGRVCCYLISMCCFLV